MSETQKNLVKAFAGESQARNKYTVFGGLARKEGLEWIARVFEETAEEERVHAKELWELLRESTKVEGVELDNKPYGKTSENLKAAATGERYEWTTMYPEFEKAAKKEGEKEAERLFGALKEVEEEHEERYLIIVRHLDEKTLYDQEAELTWKCVNCGYIYTGKTPPKVCPLCKKPFTWFMPLGLVK
ncbi:rubrerythrin family protein [Patescibacteria group bacterium]|nr:rubrerythrin family protein [Patescibacteria group bacterium]